VPHKNQVAARHASTTGDQAAATGEACALAVSCVSMWSLHCCSAPHFHLLWCGKRFVSSGNLRCRRRVYNRRPPVIVNAHPATVDAMCALYTGVARRIFAITRRLSRDRAFGGGCGGFRPADKLHCVQLAVRSQRARSRCARKPPLSGDLLQPVAGALAAAECAPCHRHARDRESAYRVTRPRDPRKKCARVHTESRGACF